MAANLVQTTEKIQQLLKETMVFDQIQSFSQLAYGYHLAAQLEQSKGNREGAEILAQCADKFLFLLGHSDNEEYTYEQLIATQGAFFKKRDKKGNITIDRDTLFEFYQENKSENSSPLVKEIEQQLKDINAQLNNVDNKEKKKLNKKKEKLENTYFFLIMQDKVGKIEQEFIDLMDVNPELVNELGYNITGMFLVGKKFFNKYKQLQSKSLKLVVPIKLIEAKKLSKEKNAIKKSPLNDLITTTVSKKVSGKMLKNSTKPLHVLLGHQIYLLEKSIEQPQDKSWPQKPSTEMESVTYQECLSIINAADTEIEKYFANQTDMKWQDMQGGRALMQEGKSEPLGVETDTYDINEQNQRIYHGDGVFQLTATGRRIFLEEKLSSILEKTFAHESYLLLADNLQDKVDELALKEEALIAKTQDNSWGGWLTGIATAVSNNIFYYAGIDSFNYEPTLQEIQQLKSMYEEKIAEINKLAQRVNIETVIETLERASIYLEEKSPPDLEKFMATYNTILKKTQNKNLSPQDKKKLVAQIKKDRNKYKDEYGSDFFNYCLFFIATEEMSADKKNSEKLGRTLDWMIQITDKANEKIDGIAETAIDLVFGDENKKDISETLIIVQRKMQLSMAEHSFTLLDDLVENLTLMEEAYGEKFPNVWSDELKKLQEMQDKKNQFYDPKWLAVDNLRKKIEKETIEQNRQYQKMLDKHGPIFSYKVNNPNQPMAGTLKRDVEKYRECLDAFELLKNNYKEEKNSLNNDFEIDLDKKIALGISVTNNIKSMYKKESLLQDFGIDDLNNNLTATLIFTSQLNDKILSLTGRAAMLGVVNDSIVKKIDFDVKNISGAKNYAWNIVQTFVKGGSIEKKMNSDLKKHSQLYESFSDDLKNQLNEKQQILEDVNLKEQTQQPQPEKIKVKNDLLTKILDGLTKIIKKVPTKNIREKKEMFFSKVQQMYHGLSKKEKPLSPLAPEKQRSVAENKNTTIKPG